MADSKYNCRIIEDLNGIFQVCISKVIKNYDNGLKLGVLVLTFKESYISDICRRLNVDKNSEGIVVSSSDESKIPINKE